MIQARPREESVCLRLVWSVEADGRLGRLSYTVPPFHPSFTTRTSLYQHSYTYYVLIQTLLSR